MRSNFSSLQSFSAFASASNPHILLDTGEKHITSLKIELGKCKHVTESFTIYCAQP